MNCYVCNSRSSAIYPLELNKDNTLFYPENRMSTMDCFKITRPKDFHIVTDSPFLVGLYDRKEVFVWKNNKWINPDIQTFGASYSIIIQDIFGYNNTIPQTIIKSDECTNCMGFDRK
jgi:hypothetical protein